MQTGRKPGTSPQPPFAALSFKVVIIQCFNLFHNKTDPFNVIIITVHSIAYELEKEKRKSSNSCTFV